MSQLAHRIRISPPLACSVAIAALLGATLLAVPMAARAAGDSISYEAIGYDRPAIDREASNYCARHGKTAVFTSQVGWRLNYDCVPSSGVAYAPAVTYAPVPAAPAYAPAPTYVPAAVPVPAYVPPAPATYVPAAPATYAPAAAYAPVPSYSTFGNGHNNPSVSYDATRYDRLAIVTAADSYCAAQGKAAAFSGRRGSLVNYDCVPYSDASHTPSAVYAPVAAPYVIYEFTPAASQASIQAEAASYCSAQGKVAVFRSQDGTRVTYDCMIAAGQTYTAPAYVAYTDNAVAPNAVPTISYSTAGNSQQNSDAPAIRYCAMLGRSPVLRDENYSTRTYNCL